MGDVINIEKHKKIGEIIVRMQRYQKLTYNFVPVPVIQVCSMYELSSRL